MKAHLLSSEDSIRDGFTYWAICGARVDNAVTKFWFDEDFRSLKESLGRTSRVCPKCIAAQHLLSDGYIFGIVDATKVPQENPEEEYVAA